MKRCNHDYDNPVRKGRADFRCPKCGKDITLELVLLRELELSDETDVIIGWCVKNPSKTVSEVMLRFKVDKDRAFYCVQEAGKKLKKRDN